jgi:peptidoglycan/xylan/chitin deacetylase (PgdA/CDA1 family)
LITQIGESKSFGVMFHHFHSSAHPKGQGAISQDDFVNMIEHLMDKNTILDAEVYHQRALDTSLLDSEICLTFDDALLSQIDVAVPVLKEKNIRAFFFVYSSAFSGEPDPLEIFRYFRTTIFNSFEDFFHEFKLLTEKHVLKSQSSELSNLLPGHEYLSDFPFYTLEDRQFRFIRDQVLTKKEYHSIMKSMMLSFNFSTSEVASKVFMTRDHLRMLSSEGHQIGLHSHSHPTLMHTLSKRDQLSEYEQNSSFIKSISGAAPTTMSHPCGNYSDETLEILKSLGVTLGFRSNRSVETIGSTLEVPREDHANILAAMQK